MGRRRTWGSPWTTALAAAAAVLVGAHGGAHPLPAGEVPAAAAETEADRGWSQPSEAAQLAAADTEPLPDGKGALFVPALTDPTAEPHLQVLDPDGAEVASGPVGRRIELDPGRYEVRLGSDPLQTGRARPVTVRAGETTLLPVDWAGLVVHVVDPNAIPLRAAYELIRLPSQESLGVGYGARVELGQRLTTWIVEPGLYLLLRRGESYRAREDFFTVRVRPGHVERLVLVVDPEDGRFRGAGEVGSLAARGTAAASDLAIGWVLGGGLALDIRRGVPGATDTTELVPSLYTDFTLTWSARPHFVYTRLKLDEEWTQEDWGAFEKELDLLRLDTLYAYEVTPWLGPYVRVGLETSLFPSSITFDEPTTVIDAADPGRTLLVGERFGVSDAFSPLTLAAGGGLRVAAEAPPYVDFWALAGLGGRQVFTRGVHEVVDDPTTPEFEVLPRGWSGDVGLEATLFLALNPARWLVLSAELEVFGPLTDLRDPTLRLEGEVGLRVTSMVGVAYTVRLERQPGVAEGLQQTHGVVLRFSFVLF